MLIVGCGDVGMRVLPLVRDHYRVFATTTTPARCHLLRAAGAIPVVMDLDAQDDRFRRLSGLADVVLYLAPPGGEGETDMRVRRLAAIVPEHARIVYISTTGVYGYDHTGWIHEHHPANHTAPRSKRRRDAEQTWRSLGRQGRASVSILRVSGIYAHDRLPVHQLEKGTPVPLEEEDGVMNLIHADDLARLLVKAITAGKPQRIYHAADGHPLGMGQYLDLIARAMGMPAPRRLPREALRQEVSPQMFGYMVGVRYIANSRIREEWQTRLRYQSVRQTLASLLPVSPVVHPDAG